MVPKEARFSEVERRTWVSGIQGLGGKTKVSLRGKTG